MRAIALLEAMVEEIGKLQEVYHLKRAELLSKYSETPTCAEEYLCFILRLEQLKVTMNKRFCNGQLAMEGSGSNDTGHVQS